MLSRWIRSWDSAILHPFLVLLAARGVTANMVTAASLAVVAAAGMAVATGHTAVGGVLLLVGGILDGLDGELARVSGCDTRFGGFLDSVCDHLGDFTVYAGLMWLLLGRGARAELLLVLAAQFGSLFGSQVRARASMAGIDTKDVGCFTRLERIATLVLGLCTGRVTAALWVLALAANFSALQRLKASLARQLPRPRRSGWFIRKW